MGTGTLNNFLMNPLSSGLNGYTAVPNEGKVWTSLEIVCTNDLYPFGFEVALWRSAISYSWVFRGLECGTEVSYTTKGSVLKDALFWPWGL